MDLDELANLAMIAVRVGVNLQRGQELIVTAPLEAHALVHQIARIAYEQGAKLVTCLYEDPDAMRERFLRAEEASFDYAAAWMSRAVAGALEEGAARLFVVGPYPDLLAGISADRVLRAHAAMAAVSKDEMRFTSASLVNWSVVPFVTRSWARTVFPKLEEGEASRRLWAAVFRATRAHAPDPVGSWQEHASSLVARREFLQRRRFSALHFHDGRTDLTVGLADGHRWVGGPVVAANGVAGICNLPTEEVFTCPHRDRTNGRMFFSRPLVLAGALVEGVAIEFKDGAVVSVRAEKGQDVLEKLIASDDGACRLGEVGLVPSSSLVAATEILFYNALLDENAASHVAFGQSYAACLESELADPTRALGAGANQSAIHIDCMVGHSSMSVDGIDPSGSSEPIMRNGEFVI